MVDVFNNHFASVAVPETHRGNVENFIDHPSVLGIASREVLEHPFTFEPVSSSYVKEILDNLNPVMAEEITRLINFLTANRFWPDEWKCGNLTPVFKKDEDTRKENYRPVSVLTALYKGL